MILEFILFFFCITDCIRKAEMQFLVAVTNVRIIRKTFWRTASSFFSSQLLTFRVKRIKMRTGEQSKFI